MNDWHNRLASQLLGDAAKFSFAPDAGASLEIAFGLARSELAYVIGLGQTHNLPVTGNAVTDDIWMKLGALSTRFRFDRRQGVIVATLPAGAEQRIGWNAEKRAITFESGEPADLRVLARDAIEAVITAWKTPPAEGTVAACAAETAPAAPTQASAPADANAPAAFDPKPAP